MKLAEALILRADLKTRGAKLKELLNANAKTQEGETPSLSIVALLAEFEEVASQTMVLIRQINKTNAQTPFSDDTTLTDALAERDVLGARLKTYRGLIDAGTIRQDLRTRSEVKFKVAFDVAELQKQVDVLAKQYRELDTKIQALNWQTDLIE